MSETKIEHAIVMFLNGMNDAGRVIEESFCGERGFRIVRPVSAKQHQKESAWSPVNSTLRLMRASSDEVDAWWTMMITQEARNKLLPPGFAMPPLLGTGTRQ